MSKYPQDLLVEPVKAAALEKQRLEAQKLVSQNPTYGRAIGDPKDNTILEVPIKAVVTPALVQRSHEVLARYTAATALSYPKGKKSDAEANIATVKTTFGIV